MYTVYVCIYIYIEICIYVYMYDYVVVLDLALSCLAARYLTFQHESTGSERILAMVETWGDTLIYMCIYAYIYI